MDTKIFYFTGTGNSLAAARSIAEGLGDSELVSIAEVFNKKVDTSASRIGFVFPVYAWSIPCMVADFVRKLDLKKEQYIFAVAACAGTAGSTTLHLQKILKERGGELSAGFIVAEHDNSLSETPGFIKVIRKIRGRKYSSMVERLPEILDIVKNYREYKPDTSSWIVNIMSNMMEGKTGAFFKKADENFRTNSGCNGCGICANICPRENIHITDQKPAWNHNCVQCMACIQWCPKEAVEYTNMAITRKHYHHPNVSLNDMKLR